MLQIENILRDFFTDAQIKEIKKLLAGIESKNLSSYLQDSGQPVETNSNEGSKSKVQFDFIITYADSVLSKNKLIDFLLTSAEILKTSGNYEITLGVYDELIRRTSDDLRFININSNCLLSKADIFRKQALWDECLFYIKKARKCFEKSKDAAKTAKCDNLLGTVYGEKGDIKKAKYHFEKSLELLKSSRDINLTGMLEINLGIINSIQGNFKESYSYYQRALIKFNRIKNFNRIAEITNNLGMLFMEKEEYDAAITQFDKSITLSQKSGFMPVLGLAYLNKAYIYTQIKDFFLASAFADKAMEICYSLNDRLSLADIYKIKGMIEGNNKNYKLAENYFLTSVRINNELSNKLNEAESLYELGILYAEMGEKQRAKQCLNSSTKYFVSINSRNMITKLKERILQLS